MALQEKHRTIFYDAFVPMLGEEVTQAVLSYFPARDVEEPVSREHLDRRFAEQNAAIEVQLISLRADLDRRFAEVDGRFAEQSARFDRRLAEQSAEFDRKLDALRVEMIELRPDTARQISELRVDVAQRIAAESDKTFHRMLTLAGVGLGVITILFAAFT